MLSKTFFQQFQAFFDDKLVAPRFDYVVPLETKGMLMLNELDAKSERGHAHVVYKRCFDFFSPDELSRKRVAIVDDTVFTGRSLNKADERLRQRGIRTTSKFAFLLVENSKTIQDRHAADISVCAEIAQENFEMLLDDLSGLSLRNRPVSPDHLYYEIHLCKPVVPEVLLDFLGRFGLVVEYERQENATTASLHYPTFSAAKTSSSARIDKVRLAIQNNGRLLRFCPELFPVLSPSEAELDEADLIAVRSQLLGVLSMEHQDAIAQEHNRYESFTLAARIAQAKGFISSIKQLGLAWSSITINTSQLQRYYGESVANRVAQIALDNALSDRHFVSTQSATSDDRSDVSFPDMFSLAEQLLKCLRDEYNRKNSCKDSLYEWESVGLSIADIQQRTGYPREVVSIGVEHLNDYGYAAPITHPGVDGKVERRYRSTEIGSCRLAL